MTKQNKLDSVEYFNYMSSLITIDARYPSEIKSSIAMGKVNVSRKHTRSSEPG